MLLLLIDDEGGTAPGADDVAIVAVLAQGAHMRGVDWERFERSEARSRAWARDWTRRVTAADADAGRVERGRSRSDG